MNIGRWQVLFSMDPREWVTFANVLRDAISYLPSYLPIYDLWWCLGPVEIRRFRKARP